MPRVSVTTKGIGRLCESQRRLSSPWQMPSLWLPAHLQLPEARSRALAIFMPSVSARVTFSDTCRMPLTSHLSPTIEFKGFDNHFRFLYLYLFSQTCKCPPPYCRAQGQETCKTVVLFFFPCCLFHKMLKNYLSIAKEIKCL